MFTPEEREALRAATAGLIREIESVDQELAARLHVTLHALTERAD
jgi:hypothetical protein